MIQKSEVYKKNREKDFMILRWIIIIFFFIVWLCTPPGNKFAQLCFYGNTTQQFIARLTDNYQATEYLFYRNSAIYMVRMDNKKGALIKMDKAIETAPTFISDVEYNNLLKERAQIKMFFKDYRGALNDYIKSSQYGSYIDRFNIALLLNKNGKTQYALSYCNSLIETDSSGYAGFACLAHVYETSGDFVHAIKTYDLLIDRTPNKARYYYDRALLKQKVGDIYGYNDDYEKAKSLVPHIDRTRSIIEETLNPKVIQLTIRNI